MNFIELVLLGYYFRIYRHVNCWWENKTNVTLKQDLTHNRG